MPRIAQEKERGLRDLYSADDKTCGYFALHATADVYHSTSGESSSKNASLPIPERAEAALDAAENAARMLWQALDGIEARRTAASVA